MDMKETYRVNDELGLEPFNFMKFEKLFCLKKVFELSSVRVVNRHVMVETQLFHKPGAHMAGTHNQYPHATFLSL